MRLRLPLAFIPWLWLSLWPWLSPWPTAVARAEPPPGPGPGPGPGPAAARLEGRILERGSSAPVAGAAVVARGGTSVTCDAQGRFAIEVAAGPVELEVKASGFEPFRLVETLAPGARRAVEYRLLPLPGQGRYGSTVRGGANHEGERFTLRDDEMHRLPGTFGDAVRVVASLPGVLQPVSILPLYVVRGGSLAMNGYYLDGMRVPELFHLVLVEGVVHPALLERLDFYPGSYDATFGRNGAGVIDVATRAARTDAAAHGEVEVKLWAVSALAEARLPGGVQLLAAGRYGYPDALLHLFAPGSDLQFWDYQLRLDWKGLTLEALGAYDALRIDLTDFGSANFLDGRMLTTFHRVQLRERARRGAVEVEAALVAGIDRMTVLSGRGVQKLALTGRVEARVHTPALHIQMGADVELSRFRGEQFESDGSTAAPDQLGELAGDRDGVVAGAYLQGTLLLSRWLGRPASLTAGVRADVYHAGTVTLLGIEPRLVARYQPLRQLEFHGGAGLYQQPPAFPVPLPGLDTFALQLGLQRSWQWSVGLKVFLPADISLSATGYYAKLQNVNDGNIDFIPSTCSTPPPELLTGIAAYTTRQLDGSAYGLELLLRRSAGRVTGWIAYTLGRSSRYYQCGLLPSDFDQTHVVTGVVQARLPWRLLAGVRLTYSTGRPYTRLGIDYGSDAIVGQRNNERLPDYFQLDVRLDREWAFPRWVLALFLEVVNVTYSNSVVGVSYPRDRTLMITRWDMPQPVGFRLVLPSVGLRATF